MNTSTTNLNNDLNKIKNWAIQWKMNFNPDPSKQTQEVIFSRKPQKTNDNQVSVTTPLNKFPLKNILECILILN